ncbi:MAG: hypothetical protein WCQ23_04805 [Candidatus Methanomethylophilaceae archaeon]
MSDPNYRKCKTCRFCIHSEDLWVCTFTEGKVDMEGTCARYRPGSCENCHNFRADGNSAVCALTGDETDAINVCVSYDPNGRRSL